MNYNAFKLPESVLCVVAGWKPTRQLNGVKSNERPQTHSLLWSFDGFGIRAISSALEQSEGGLRMAFVNEWISEEDMEKYHIREIRKKMVADKLNRLCWVRDRERDMYLMKIRGLGQENEFEVWLLYARGKYAAVRIYCVGSEPLEDGTVHKSWRFVAFHKGLFFTFPKPPQEDLPAIFRLLEEALSVYGREGIRAFEPEHPGEYFVKTKPVVYRATIEPEKN